MYIAAGLMKKAFILKQLQRLYDGFTALTVEGSIQAVLLPKRSFKLKSFSMREF